MNDLNRHIYEIDELVIGNSLEAVSYSYLNEKPIILNSIKKPYFFEFFEKGSCLEKYTTEVNEYELEAPHGVKTVGASKLEVWEKLVFYLSLAGLVPLADKVFSIRIEEDNLLKITTNNSRMAKIKFNKLRIFDTENISGFSSLEENGTYKVVDWVNVRSGMKHNYDYLETGDEFIKEIYFYPSERVGGGENDERKDLVAVSYLSKKQIDNFEYSDTYAKFKILSLMREAGIKGARNGKRHDDPNKYAYYSVKIEPSHREVRLGWKSLHGDTNFLTFDYRQEREIYEQSDSTSGFLNKVRSSLND